MTNNITSIFTQNTINVSTDKITKTLSKYTEKIINKDKSITYTEIPTDYFLENDKWHIDFFSNIEQFKKQIEDYNYSSRNIFFLFKNENINKEMKFIVYNKLFSDKWGVRSSFTNQMQFIRQLSKFINEKYPNINSFKELNLEKTNIQWIDWLSNNGIKTIQKQNTWSKMSETERFAANSTANF